MKSHFTSILRNGKQTNEGPFTSKRIEKLHQKRYLKIKDVFHKVSHHIVKLAQEEEVCKIVIGQNKSWKQETNMGKKNNQSFCHIAQFTDSNDYIQSKCCRHSSCCN